MDQMSNLSYKNNIQSTFDAAKAQGNGKKRTNAPKIIGKGGYVFEFVDGKIVPHYTPEVLKFLAKKEPEFINAGLLRDRSVTANAETVAVNSTELIAER